MRAIPTLLIAASAAALSACGSHVPAPIVYGTQPATTGRIYNSPADYARVNAKAQPAQQRQAAPAPSYAASGPAPLTPVTEASIYRSELPPAPTYISLDEPRAAPQRDGQVTVRPGDTVYAISRRTGASPQAIIAENHLRAPYTLVVGDTLRVPDASEKIANITEHPPARPVRTQVRSNSYVVRRGDTLYSISRSTGASVDVIAQANRLRSPYALSVGDELTIPGAPIRTEAPRQIEAKAPAARVEDLARNVSYEAPAPAVEPARLFEWPVKGSIIGEYGAGSMGRRNDGVNIAAPVGTPVRAAAAGEVVYRGSELDGYGNLLLVKHDDGYVTAYAHNDVMLVKKGQRVDQGQVIAKVGKTGSASEPQLHFEIRQNLKSVDPLALLQN